MRKKTGPKYFAEYWNTFREITDTNGNVVSDFVCCSNCNKVFTYLTKMGTRKLNYSYVRVLIFSVF